MLDCEDDAYTAYCFDEACLYIRTQMEAGLKPVFVTSVKKVKTMKELYDSI